MENKIKVKRKEVNTPFKLVIKPEIVNKVNYVAKKVGYNIEWSGVLFYKAVSGDTDNVKDLLIEVVDFVPLNIGNSSYTEYQYNTIFTNYCMEHNLFDCYFGHIHSHHSMATFFSGTDMQELEDSAPKFNAFLSLIVNNSESYSAKLSFVVDSKVQVNKKSSFVKFGGEEVPEFNSETELDVREIYIYPASIEMEPQSSSFGDIDTLIETLKKEQRASNTNHESNIGYFNSLNQNNCSRELPFNSGYGILPRPVNTEPVVQEEVFSDELSATILLKQLFTLCLLPKIDKSLYIILQELPITTGFKDISEFSESVNTILEVLEGREYTNFGNTVMAARDMLSTTYKEYADRPHYKAVKECLDFFIELASDVEDAPIVDDSNIE